MVEMLLQNEYSSFFMDAKNIYCTQLLLQITHASPHITKLQNIKLKYQLLYSIVFIKI